VSPVRSERSVLRRQRSGSAVSQGVRDAFWLVSLQVGFKTACDCVKIFSETDLTDDLKWIDVPTLIIHGDDDQIVPIDDSGRLSAKIVEDAELKEYPGASHGLFQTHKEQFNGDLLTFVKR
jgi:non-heme chloroperoxidase